MRDKEEFAVVFRGRRRRIPRSRTFGALNHFVRGVLPSYSHVAESMLRVVRVHAGTVILPNQARSSAPMHKTIGGTRRRDPCKHERAYGFDVWGALRRA